jgi:hypothetical protein
MISLEASARFQVCVADLVSLSRREVTIMLAIGLMLTGVYLRWQMTERQMSIEERLKDGWLTAEQARWRMQLMRWSGPVVSLLGIALLALLWLR